MASVPPLSFPLEPTLPQCQDLPECPFLPLDPKLFRNQDCLGFILSPSPSVGGGLPRGLTVCQVNQMCSMPFGLLALQEEGQQWPGGSGDI